MNLEAPLWRAVPVEEVALRVLPIPVPLDRLPQPSDALVEIALGDRGSLEVLPRGQESLHHEGGLDQIAAVVQHAEERHGLAGSAVHVVGPRAVIALRVLEEAYDAEQAVESLLAGDEVPVDADEQRQDPEARGAGRDDSGLARDVFVSHARTGLGTLPVILKGCF